MTQEEFGKYAATLVDKTVELNIQNISQGFSGRIRREYAGSDHESLKLFRVWFHDHSAMLIDARNREYAAELSQAWSLKWDRLDSRRVVTVTKL